MGEYLADLEAGEAPTNVYYGISPMGYENLSTNMAEIKRYIDQQKQIIIYYEKAVAPKPKPEKAPVPEKK